MTSDTFANPSQIAILATAFVTLVTTIAGLAFQFIREDRRHRWEVEAARRHAEASKRSNEERKEIAARVEDASVTLNAKIDENTEISRQAFTEANHMNEKLAEQGRAFDRLLQIALVGSSTDVSSAIDAVKTTVDDTAGQVTDIHKRVVDDA